MTVMDKKREVLNRNAKVLMTILYKRKINNVETEKGVMHMKKAVYAASFDPFTKGHLDILTKASKMFDEVYAVIAVNKDKKRRYLALYMKEAIESCVKNNHLNNCHIEIYDGLIAEYCRNNNIEYTVRGLRNSMDFAYEENIANVNKLILPSLETVYLRAEYVGISSSMVKELFDYGQDVSQFVPVEILPVLRTF